MRRFALLVALLVAGPVAAADPLAAVLKDNAPGVLRKLKDKKYANVGVLPFARPDAAPDKANELGELSLTLAARTAQALTLANTDDAFTVLQNPARQAKGVKGANPLTVEGRKKFFTIDYLPGFGQDKVQAAALIVGTAELSADLKTLKIKLKVCDSSGELADLSDEWVAEADAGVLGEAGKGYTVPKEKRAALVTGEAGDVVRESAEQTQKVVAGPAEKKRKANPALENCPVKWEVRYDTKLQEVDGDTLPEPDEKVEAEFTLVNPSKDETFAVVLLVNGENTLGRERVDVLKCRKWVLPPGAEVVVKGFQVDNKRADKFVVVPTDDRRVDRVRDLADFGTFRLVVFAGKVVEGEDKPGEKPAETPTNQTQPAEIIASTRLGDEPTEDMPATRKGLMAKLSLKTGTLANTRGVLTGGGGDVESKTQVVRFVPASDTPVSNIPLRYHTPKK